MTHKLKKTKFTPKSVKIKDIFQGKKNILYLINIYVQSYIIEPKCKILPVTACNWSIDCQTENASSADIFNIEISFITQRNLYFE